MANFPFFLHDYNSGTLSCRPLLAFSLHWHLLAPANLFLCLTSCVSSGGIFNAKTLFLQTCLSKRELQNVDMTSGIISTEALQPEAEL